MPSAFRYWFRSLYAPLEQNFATLSGPALIIMSGAVPELTARTMSWSVFAPVCWIEIHGYFLWKSCSTEQYCLNSRPV